MGLISRVSSRTYRQFFKMWEPINDQNFKDLIKTCSDKISKCSIESSSNLRGNCFIGDNYLLYGGNSFDKFVLNFDKNLKIESSSVKIGKFLSSKTVYVLKFNENSELFLHDHHSMTTIKSKVTSSIEKLQSFRL